MNASLAPLEVTQSQRWELKIQQTRGAVYLISLLVGLSAWSAGIFQIRIAEGLLVIALGLFSAVALDRLSRWGAARRIQMRLEPIWMAIDVGLITWGVVITGGLESPWYYWYLSNVAAAAFVAGRAAALVVSGANIASYLGVLLLTGEIALFDENFTTALFRLIFLAGASAVALFGVANLRDKRVLIESLRREEGRVVEKFTALTSELDARGRELADANRRIREADRMKSQFLANMSHELRTPMNSIIGFSEILIERLASEIAPRYLDFLGHINNSGQHLLSIINDVLDLSKIEAGKLDLYPETFEVREAIDGVCNVMKGQALKKQVQFVIEVPAGIPQLETDVSKFKQILFNLLSNATKFSPSGSSISIRASLERAPQPEDDALRISVSDAGIGISPENHELVWQEFRQVDGTTQRGYGGTGLGLALVRKFVEIQRGIVGLDSGLGSGSVFWFQLPIRFQGESQHHRDPSVLDRAFLPGERILVVEDDDNAYESICRDLASTSYIPIRAHHGEEAIRLARLVKPVAITLDLVLPGLDGWEVLKVLKSDPDTRDVPVVIISIMDNRELGLALGAYDYFVKPVDRQRLLERLKQISNQSKTVRPRLLLIDDDVDFHELLESEMDLIGYQLRGAFSGTEGLTLARNELPDVIILDLMMPGLSGFQVAETLKEDSTTAHIPILVMTAKDLTNEDRDALRSKISAVVPKGPSAKSRLIAEIRRLERPVTG